MENVCFVVNKKDVDSKVAKLVLWMENMPKSKDDVEVLYPTDRSARKDSC